MDFSLPVKDQEPAPGYIPGRSIVLVRNPAWDAATDDLRRPIRTASRSSIGGNNDDLYNKIKSDDSDFVVDGAVPPETIREYQTDPDLQGKINVYPSDALRYISFNCLTPPFDDIHVRKAFNWALDKDGMRQLRGGATTGEIAGHIMVNSLENDLLKDLRPVRDAERRPATSRRPRKRWPNRSTTPTRTASVTRRSVPTSWP